MTDTENRPAEAPAPAPDAPAASGAGRAALEWGALIVGALVIALVLRTLLFQVFYIPSESMVPTLKVGDRVIVNKLSYKLHDVHRGDIVVFEAPPAADAGDIKDLVKRVIGLPGDTVQAEDGKVYVNGRRLEEPYLPAGTPTVIDDVPPGCLVPVAQQDLPSTEQSGCRVPPGQIFVMGDNRTVSRDSHIFGPVKESSIVGRVFLKIWPPQSFHLM